MTTAEPSVLRLGERLAQRYELLEVLEQGDLACLYLANDPQLERSVAIKVFDFRNRSDLDTGTFLNEARRIAQLQHPGLIPIFDSGHLDALCFFVQPPPRGRSLAHWLARPSHQIPTARPYVHESTTLRCNSAQGRTASTTASLHGSKPCISKDLRPLATKSGDPFGLVAERGDEAATAEGADDVADVLSRADLLAIGTRLAEVLSFLASHELMHGDVCAETVQVEREGGELRVWLHDFCLPSFFELRLREGVEEALWPTSCRAPEFRRSEVASGGVATIAGDVYALGALLYCAITGQPTRRLFDRVRRSGGHAPPPAAGWADDTVLEELVAACLEADPELRPSPRELEATLERCRRRAAEDAYRSSDSLRRSRHGLLLDLPQAAERSESRRGPSTAPFVGRKDELRQLLQCLQRTVSGECHWVMLGGERGIGKSRLMHEVAILAERRGVRVLTGRCLEQNESFPHDGFCGLIQDYFRQASLDRLGGGGGTSAGGSAAFEAGPPTSPPEDINRWRPLAADLLTLFPALEGISELRRASLEPTPTGPPVPFDSADPTHVYELLARTLSALAAGQPLLVILESLHRSPASVEALSFIHYRLRLTPLLILCSYQQRDVDIDHPLMAVRRDMVDDPRAFDVALGALPPAEHARLSAHWSGVEALPAALAMRLYEATDGNPFFTRELIHSLLEEEADLELASGRRSGSLELDLIRLPDTVQQAVRSRLQSLPRRPSKLISTAAVLGRQFDAEDLLALVEDAAAAEDDLDDLVHRGLLQEDGGGRGDLLSFASSVVRDALYQQLPRRRRRLLHRRYAELLEERHGRHLERVYPLLVHHFSAADDGTRTVTYALMLARRFDDVASAPDVIRATQAALEFLADESWEGAGEDAGEVEGELQELLAGALRRKGSTRRALQAAERSVAAFERAEELRAAARMAHFAAETAWRGRRVSEVEQWIQRGMELATASTADSVLRELLLLRAMVANLWGDHALAHASLAHADRLGVTVGGDGESLQGLAVGDDGATAGGTVVTVLPHPVTGLDPMDFGTAENLEVLANVFECLVKSDGEGHWLPGLATSWESEDAGRGFVFELRAGVTFSDGTPFTAAHVVRSWERGVRLGGRRAATALTAIAGFDAARRDPARPLEGLEILGDHRLRVSLARPLSIFPALLSDLRTGIVAGEEGELVGTGPFVVNHSSPRSVQLERNPSHWQRSPSVYRLEFRTHYDAAGIAAAWEQGQLDLARDLAPVALDDMLRRPRRRGQFVETPRSNVYYVVFNSSRGPLAEAPVRQALCAAVGVEDVVWGCLGRLARPAAGWLPPGVLGHDEQRRAPRANLALAEDLLRQSGVERPLTLKATVHPQWLDRYLALSRALQAQWQALGIYLEVTESALDAAYDRYDDVADIDVLFDRWLADYEDPDDFTYGLFAAEHGLLRNYLPADAGPDSAWQRLMEEGRLEDSPVHRQRLYGQWQRELRQRALALPVFHEIDYRLASLRLRDVELRSLPPYVDYQRLSKQRGAGRRPDLQGGSAITKPRSWRRQTLRIPFSESFAGIDPIHAFRIEVGEVSPCLFETLTRIRHGAQVMPWLAERIESEDGDRRFHVTLRRDVRLHDGRPLTAHHVAASLRRLLRLGTHSLAHFALSPVRGAAAYRDGADDLSGVTVESDRQLIFDLEHPTPTFAARLACPTTAIVVPMEATPGDLVAVAPTPSACLETQGFDLLGTGPFRWRRPGGEQGLDLEASPHYWRRGLPRCDRLIFEFGVTPEAQGQGFQSGHYDLVGDLPGAELDALRQVPGLRATSRETPRFSTVFMAFNCRRGPLADPLRRAALVQAMELDQWLEGAVGLLGQPAKGLIPPALPGSVGDDPRQEYDLQPSRLQGLFLRVAVHPIVLRRYPSVWRRVLEVFERLKIQLEVVECRTSEVLAADREQRVDLVLGRWIALFPDTDAFLAVFTAFAGQLYEDREVVALIDQGRRTTGPKARHDLYRDVERRLVERLLVLPLFHEQIHRLVRSDVGSLRLGFGWPEVEYEELRRN